MRSKTVRPRLLLLALLALLLPLGSGACSRSGGADDDAAPGAGSASEASEEKGKKRRKSDEDSDADKEPEPVPVEVVSLGRGPIESVLRFSTNLEAESEVQVFSQAARQVRQLFVEEGDEVAKGQVLLRLQDDEQRTALARVESQLAKARREYDRQTNLYEQQLISEQLFNEATYEIEQLELALKDAQRELGYTEVRAPIKGTVTARRVNVGALVTINQHLFDIVDFDSIVARVYVPEKDLARVRAGQPARIYAAAAGGGDARLGTVERLAPRVDPRSGTVKVTVAVPRGAELLPGMYVSVELITALHDDALLVPKKALVYDADQLFVFRLAGEDRVERLLVEAVLEDRDHIEPRGPLAAGDRVVVAGQAGLKDGALVRRIEPGASRGEGLAAETGGGEPAL